MQINYGKIYLKHAKTLLTIGLIAITGMAVAAPSEMMIADYNQAAGGDYEKLDKIYEDFIHLNEHEPSDAVTLIYMGATETLKADDAMMPWVKLRLVEKGVANIEKGLGLLDSNSYHHSYLMGMTQYDLAKSNAAVVLSSLPTMFKQLENSYELYQELIPSKSFQASPFVANAWVYRYAVDAAVKLDDIEQATKWLELMEKNDHQHPETIAAQSLLVGAEG